MKLVRYVAVLALLTLTSACSDWASDWFNHVPPPTDHPFANDQSQHCSPPDQNCSSGGGNPSVQAPARSREQNVQ